MENQQLSIARETISTPGGEEGTRNPSNDDTDASTADENTTTASKASNSNEQLRFGKHVCPEEYIHSFTPMEFEEVGGFDMCQDWSQRVAWGICCRKYGVCDVENTKYGLNLGISYFVFPSAHTE